MRFYHSRDSRGALAEFQMVPSSACRWKWLLQFAASLGRTSLLVWLLRPSTVSHLGTVSASPLWVGAGNGLEKLDSYPRKHPWLNNRTNAVPPASSGPPSFLRAAVSPVSPGEACATRQTLSEPCLSIPTWTESRCLRAIHSLTFVFSAARVPQSFGRKLLYFWEKGKGIEKMTISYICNIL